MVVPFFLRAYPTDTCVQKKNNMAHSYEEYDVKAKTYTGLRKTVGHEAMLKHYEGNAKPIAEQKLCDAGCGTGNYSVRFIDSFSAIHCTDYSAGMLEHAQKNLTQKFEGALPKERLSFAKGDITNLTDLKDGTFDAVCNNQVVHHLRPDNDFQDLKDTVKEFHRILGSGGRATLNWTPPEQADVIWFLELIPEASKKWLLRTPSLAVMKKAFEEAGFKDVHSEPCHESLYNPKMYDDPRKFLEQEFWLSDSTFNLATPDEINAGCERVKAMEADGTLDAWFAKKREKDVSEGMSSIMFGVKA